MPSDQEVPAMPEVAAVNDLDWATVRSALDAVAIRARMPAIVREMEALLDRQGGPGLLFDSSRATAADRVINVLATDDAPLWIIGDLHGDLLALEAALLHIRRTAVAEATPSPRLIFLGDFIDDQGLAL